MINPEGRGFKATINGKIVKILYSDFFGSREVELIVEQLNMNQNSSRKKTHRLMGF